MSFSDPVPPLEPSTDKYWITDLNRSSVKSAYAIKFTLINKPTDEPAITTWLSSTFGSSGYKYKVVEGLFYAEIFFKSESDATMFVLKCGDLLT